MPDLLLELRSEEIPARMQRKAAGDLRQLLTNALVEAGLTYEAATAYWTPRRLTLDVRGLEARSKPVREEVKGPSVTAPSQAIDGFLRKAGLASISDATIQNDPKKGDFYVAVTEKPGRAAEDIIAAAMPDIIRNFPWPKSMRWGAASREPGSLRWVRPLQSIVCTFGPETEEPMVVDFEISGIRSSNVTYGHRFHAPDAITVRRFDDYIAKLEKAFVVLDAERRKEIILADARNLAFANGLELIEDEALLEEVSGLVEWPVVLMGEFEKAFLAIPDEMTRLTIKTNQKCFVTRGPDGKLSNKFILVANLAATDGGAEIAHGNGKVVRARLSDALYFWNTDQAALPDLDGLKASAEKFDLDLNRPLDQRMARLDALNVTFHVKLGSQGERVLRIAKLARELAPVVGADADLAYRAAILSKADLQTEAVGEFPELQGLMGRKYAELQGEHSSVCAAIEEHYKPQGPSDTVPRDAVSIAVALADKLDTLVGFWAIDEKPTGSKDPFALRRAALGVIRIVLERGVSLYLLQVWLKTWVGFYKSGVLSEVTREIKTISSIMGLVPQDAYSEILEAYRDERSGSFRGIAKTARISKNQSETDLLSFFHDRLKVYLREQGARHDVIDAVIKPEMDNLLDITRRVEQLTVFLDSDDGKNLVAGTKRAANFLNAEEKKGTVSAHVDEQLLNLTEEKALANAIQSAEPKAEDAMAIGDYSAAMSALAALRAPVDAFLVSVLVNDADAAIRANRLALLKRVALATDMIADFSKISG